MLYVEQARLDSLMLPRLSHFTPRRVRDCNSRCHNYSQLIKNLVVSVIAYGDETYDPGMPWNVGNCILGIGVSLYKLPFKHRITI
jgi:hypothetical protein